MGQQPTVVSESRWAAHVRPTRPSRRRCSMGQEQCHPPWLGEHFATAGQARQGKQRDLTHPFLPPDANAIQSTEIRPTLAGRDSNEHDQTLAGRRNVRPISPQPATRHDVEGHHSQRHDLVTSPRFSTEQTCPLCLAPFLSTGASFALAGQPGIVSAGNRRYCWSSTHLSICSLS